MKKAGGFDFPATPKVERVFNAASIPSIRVVDVCSSLLAELAETEQLFF